MVGTHYPLLTSLLTWRCVVIRGMAITAEGSRSGEGVSSIKWRLRLRPNGTRCSVDDLEGTACASGDADPRSPPTRPPTPLGHSTLWELLLHRLGKLQQVVEGFWLHLFLASPEGCRGQRASLSKLTLCHFFQTERHRERVGAGSGWTRHYVPRQGVRAPEERGAWSPSSQDTGHEWRKAHG